jgi:2-iminobutanoate/2-iminopropanoate deaminase
MRRLASSRLAAIVVVPLSCVLLATPGIAAEPDRPKPEFLSSPSAAMRDLPFSEAVRAGDLLFLSGQLGFDEATGKVVPGGIVAESRQTLELIKRALERNGSSLADVVKCTVFLADIAEWPAFNNVYREFFKKPFPARSALAASGLAMGARVEVECIAYAPTDNHRFRKL